MTTKKTRPPKTTTPQQYRTATRTVFRPYIDSDRTVVARRRIPFRGTVATLIDDAHHALVPERRIVGLSLMWSPTVNTLQLAFSSDQDGRQLSIEIRLRPADAPLVAAFLIGSAAETAAIIHTTVPVQDGDGGEALEVPTVTARALAAMTSIGGISWRRRDCGRCWQRRVYSLRRAPARRLSP